MSSWEILSLENFELLRLPRIYSSDRKIFCRSWPQPKLHLPFSNFCLFFFHKIFFKISKFFLKFLISIFLLRKLFQKLYEHTVGRVCMAFRLSRSLHQKLYKWGKIRHDHSAQPCSSARLAQYYALSTSPWLQT